MRQEKRNTLRLRITRFQEMQIVYMPGVPEIREGGIAASTPSAHDIINHPTGRPSTQKETASLLPERECLWLPSAIPKAMRDEACIPNLVHMELRMQLAIADDSLDNLRRQLRIASTIRYNNHIDGAGTSQRLGSRSQSVLQRFADKIERHTARYRAAYAAIVSLDPDGEWKERFQPLKPEDVRSPHRDRDEDVPSSKKKARKKNDRSIPSEGKRELSWIWLRNGASGRPTMDNLTADQIGDGE